jgi:hypothetical protein
MLSKGGIREGGIRECGHGSRRENYAVRQGLLYSRGINKGLLVWLHAWKLLESRIYEDEGSLCISGAFASRKPPITINAKHNAALGLPHHNTVRQCPDPVPCQHGNRADSQFGT